MAKFSVEDVVKYKKDGRTYVIFSSDCQESGISRLEMIEHCEYSILLKPYFDRFEKESELMQHVINRVKEQELTFICKYSDIQ